MASARADISRGLVQLHAEYYGRGPTRAKTSISGDLVAVVLEETFTRAERTLLGHGDVDAILEIRRKFQQRMADQFKSVVEQATGRKVRAFLSETSLEADLAVEIFILSEARTDMAGFEQDALQEGDG